MHSSHWRLDGAPAECMAPQRGLLLPLLPVAWVPVADIFHSNGTPSVMSTVQPPHQVSAVCAGQRTGREWAVGIHSISKSSASNPAKES